MKKTDRSTESAGSVVPLREKGKTAGNGAASRSGESARPQRRRRGYLALSFLLFVLLPALAGLWFWFVVASDRYVAGAGFSVRSMEQGAGMDLLGGLTGMAGSGSTSSDAYIVMEYLESRDLVARIEARRPLREIYSGDDVDPLFRLDPGAGLEDRVAYWRGRIEADHDRGSGIITFRVEAFTPEDAGFLAGAVLDEVQSLVNRLSEAARAEAARSAGAEVARAEARLRAAMRDLRRFREENREIDPAASAAARLQIDTRIETELAQTRARIDALRASLDEDAPTLVALKRRAAALEAQISGAWAPGQGGAEAGEVSDLLERFEAIGIEKSFAQQAYTASLSSLEKARAQADSQQRYLAVFSAPSEPELATRPARARNALMLIICAFSLWGIGTLIVYSVRDHLS